MEPEGRTTAENPARELLSQIGFPDDARHDEQNEDVSEVIRGNAFFTYRKPIFTAVVIPQEELPSHLRKNPQTDALANSSVQTSEPLKLAPASLYSSSSNLEDKPTLLQDTEQAKADEWLLGSLYKFSLIFGLLVGCFIQSSSLGANYVLIVLYGRDYDIMNQHHKNIVGFSLAWSFLTSIMGITILLILRSLITLATYGLSHTETTSQGRSVLLFKRPLSLVVCLEFPFAFGALVGVCGSWATTDLLLGLKSHAYQSLFTLTVAYACKSIFVRIVQSPMWKREVVDTTSEPLLGSKKALVNTSEPLVTQDISAEEKVRCIHAEFKVKGLATGLLVGFFIQLSSLGASFMIDTMTNDSQKEPGSSMSKDKLFLFSFGWSFVFGTMGVAILLLQRYLVAIVCDHILQQSSDQHFEEDEEMTKKWSINLEFYFAVGCLIGVNVAWLLTDVGLGLNAHIWRSLGTLVAAGAWCSVLAYCCGFRKATGNSKQADDEGRKSLVRATYSNHGLLVV